jgi:3-oxoacyl-[acyl-carrier protein] reductase
MLDPDAFRLDEKVIVITGAARGLGRSMALGFASFGARVMLCDRMGDELADTAAAVAALGGAPASTAVLDVRDNAAVTEWIGTMEHVDVLVNNAAGTFHGAVLDASSNAQRALVDANFTSVTNFVRACVPKMPSGGSIINITSVEAFRASPGFGIYGAMKAAVEHLTRTLALELSSRGIRVNSIAPDGLPTPGDGELLQSTHDDYARKLALGWGTSDDICGAAVFLASAASRYVTGSTIHVDGGSDAARGWSKDADGNWIP